MFSTVFSSLSRKLTLFYGGLFAAALLVAIFGVSYGIERHAEATSTREMAATTQVFDHVLDVRSDQLRDAADVMAGDFGFREAVALGEAPTVVSALGNLRNRLGLSLAMLVTIDGDIVTGSEALPAASADAIWEAVDHGAEGGVLMIGDQPYMTVASEVRTPQLAGWVVFGYLADESALADMAGMTSLAVSGRIVSRSSLSPSLRDGLLGSERPMEVQENGERILVSGNSLDSLIESDQPVLILRHSLSEALAGYDPMLWRLGLIGLFTLMLGVIGSFFLSQHISRPLKALAAATRRISNGDSAEVEIETSDEIGSLASDFNAMVGAIGERERRISHLAFHDTLTGLPNRALFREQLDQALKRVDVDGKLAILCIDLDNFKTVNDTLGHPIGDKLLQHLAGVYAEILGGETIARLGGDEFSVILEGDVTRIAGRAMDIIEATKQTFIIDGHSVVTGASIGIAIAHQDGEDADTLLKNADMALYRVKEDGRSDYRFFEDRMDEQAQERRQMEIDLRNALSQGELELHFQPLFCLRENRVTSFEALLRWEHPERGKISPVDFIPLAEETGLIMSIGEWVIHEACRIASMWSDDMRVAVNVSPIQFRNPGLKNVIFQALAATGLEPSRLEVEITESVLIQDVDATLQMLHDIHRLGVRVALDDFGTGYSSLAYLRSFPFDKIKIDRSFIVDIMRHPEAVAIVKSITTLADALGMETTAEGVEDQEQLDVLREQGCSHIQGFLFSQPVSSGQIENLLAAIHGKSPRQSMVA